MAAKGHSSSWLVDCLKIFSETAWPNEPKLGGKHLWLFIPDNIKIMAIFHFFHLTLNAWSLRRLGCDFLLNVWWCCQIPYMLGEMDYNDDGDFENEDEKHVFRIIS
jgi:hypothetical protein